MTTELPYTEAWLEGPQSTLFYTRTFTCEQPKAAVVFVHGFAEHVGRYDHIHHQYPEHGIGLFTYDQRGFGRTALDKNHSKTSAWGKTSWKNQMEDIEWALAQAKEKFPGVPVFLMGHSMGGGEVLGYATDKTRDTSALAGIIATSPLIQQTKPASKLLRWIGGKASTLSPYTVIPVELNVDDLSHDPKFNEAYAKDPLIKASGSLRGVSDMLSKGDELHQRLYQDWPKNLPVLFVHGTGDKITSYEATQAFHDKISAEDKKIVPIDGGYHELQNEPDGVKDQLVNEVFAFIDSHLPQAPALAKM
ncbi:hypothetical protein VNI00_011669 [Paramarasmius palmivorus]|uniref:Serine aminopeptidase S33 domain-containing protein n=1 Tax=Paramarasmius palmivorus TaxID=297713 RepID=A0AAW0CBU7_9AGAR